MPWPLGRREYAKIEVAIVVRRGGAKTVAAGKESRTNQKDGG